jgi:hypothetical protein
MIEEWIEIYNFKISAVMFTMAVETILPLTLPAE